MTAHLRRYLDKNDGNKNALFHSQTKTNWNTPYKKSFGNIKQDKGVIKFDFSRKYEFIAPFGDNKYIYLTDPV